MSYHHKKSSYPGSSRSDDRDRRGRDDRYGRDERYGRDDRYGRDGPRSSQTERSSQHQLSVQAYFVAREGIEWEVIEPTIPLLLGTGARASRAAHDGRPGYFIEWTRAPTSAEIEAIMDDSASWLAWLKSRGAKRGQYAYETSDIFIKRRAKSRPESSHQSRPPVEASHPSSSSPYADPRPYASSTPSAPRTSTADYDALQNSGIAGQYYSPGTASAAPAHPYSGRSAYDPYASLSAPSTSYPASSGSGSYSYEASSSSGMGVDPYTGLSRAPPQDSSTSGAPYEYQDDRAPARSRQYPKGKHPPTGFGR